MFRQFIRGRDLRCSEEKLIWQLFLQQGGNVFASDHISLSEK